MNLSLPKQSSVRSLRLMLAIVLCLVVVPLVLKAAAPSWWVDRGVVDISLSANDYAAVNQGQIKNMAQQAMQELDDHLPGGAGEDVHDAYDIWSPSTAITNDFSPVKLGALKELARPFYERLIIVGYTNDFPWAGKQNLANDYAAANIGQAKNLFSFDLVSATSANDSNHNGIG